MNGHARARLADHEEFNTCRNPQDYHVDWRSFYEQAAGQAEAMRADWPHDVDVRYGPDPYQLANVYHPRNASGAPVLLFLHGGRFREGHPLYYDFIGRPWLERGAIYVSLGYRLEPECQYPGSAQDVRSALAWAFTNVARYGGDAERIFIGGHSSGATLAAVASVTGGWHTPHGVPADVVKGSVLLSGIYDFRGGLRPLASGSPEAASPLCAIDRVPARMVVAYGAKEPNRRGEAFEVFAQQAAPFVDAVRDAGGDVDDVPLDDADHIQTAMSLAEVSNPVFRAATEMLGVLPERETSNE